MTALSMTRGRPIGIVKGGEDDKEIVGLIDEKEKTDPEGDPVDLLGEDFFRGLRKKDGKKFSLRQLTELIESVRSGEMPDDEDIQEAFHLALETFLEADKAEIKIDDGEIRPFPNFEIERECGYICGPSGSGKSSFTALYCQQYRKAQPDKKIYLFSRVEEDKVLDVLEPSRVLLNEDFAKTPPASEDFKDSICIFDDIDTIVDKKIAESVQKLRDDMLETGRHKDITVLCTSHQVSNYKKTKVMLNEATFVVMFPRSGSSAQIVRYLKEHAGLDLQTRNKIMKVPSRWVLHYRHAPQYILHEKGAFTL